MLVVAKRPSLEGIEIKSEEKSEDDEIKEARPSKRNNSLAYTPNQGPQVNIPKETPSTSILPRDVYIEEGMHT